MDKQVVLDELRAEHQKKVEQLTHDIEVLDRKRNAAEAAVNALQKQMQEGIGTLTNRLQDELPKLNEQLDPAIRLVDRPVVMEVPR